MGKEAEPTGRPLRLGMVVLADVAVVLVEAGEEAASDDSASELLPLSS